MTRLGSCFVPDYLLRHLARTGAIDPQVVEQTLRADDQLRARRGPVRTARPAAATGARWVVHTADGTTRLPGTPVRAEGEPATGDPAVDEAAVGVTASLDLFRDVYDRDSYDGAGAQVSLTVHYGQQYANAFWDGTQLVFGDGDGEIFGRFTAAVDVLGHELTHAVTEHTAGLVYQGQSGALNESVSDVFASCARQRLLGQDADAADWLIGAGIFRPGVQARALRDMAAPGTAYDDPRLGTDPQPDHMDDYIVTSEDNGGVHLNSGIPNRAFVLAARALGGTSADGAGQIWYSALTSGDLSARATFAQFAAVTVAAAGGRAGPVADAWAQVGVEPAASGVDPVPTGGAGGGSGGGAGGGSGGDATGEGVRVVRSGGFAGRIVEGQAPASEAVDRVLERLDLAAVRSGAPHPDGFVYTFHLPDGRRLTVPEHHLTDDLRALARVALGEPGSQPGGQATI